jgi:hypothetical protein
MSTTSDNPAFPGAINKNLTGLTKREYFAGLALQGVVAHEGSMMEGTASRAVRLADELIETLNKKAKK